MALIEPLELWGLTLLHMPLRSFLLIILTVCVGMIVKERGNPRKDIKIISGILLVLIPLVFYFLNPLVDLNLTRFELSFQQIVHPEESHLIQSWSKVGLLRESSTHCDYFKAELRAAPLTLAELRPLYFDQHIQSAETIGDKTIPVEFTSLRGLKHVLQLPIESVKIEPLLANHTLYVVWAQESGSLFSGDIRCQS